MGMRKLDPADVAKTALDVSGLSRDELTYLAGVVITLYGKQLGRIALNAMMAAVAKERGYEIVFGDFGPMVGYAKDDSEAGGS